MKTLEKIIGISLIVALCGCNDLKQNTVITRDGKRYRVYAAKDSPIYVDRIGGSGVSRYSLIDENHDGIADSKKEGMIRKGIPTVLTLKPNALSMDGFHL